MQDLLREAKILENLEHLVMVAGISHGGHELKMLHRSHVIPEKVELLTEA